jgi:hypothetical protein
MSNKPKTSTKEHLYDVFLSHNSCDKEVVEEIARRLEDEANLRPFLDKWHLVPGEPWQEELEKALDASSTCAVFVSANGLSSWENEEMRTALNERATNKSLRVIPVLLPDSSLAERRSLPRFLQRFTWVDFRDGVQSRDAFQRLVAGIEGKAPGRIQPKDSSLINEQQTIQWVFVLEGTVDLIDMTFIEAITSQLRELSGDATLTIRKVKRGSLILVVESSEVAFERIRSLFRSGELDQVEGMTLIRVSAYHSTLGGADKAVWDPVLAEIARFSNFAQEGLAKIDSRDLAIILHESQTQNEEEDLLLTPKILAEWPSEIVTQFVKWAHRHKSVIAGGKVLSDLAEHILRSYEISRKLPTKREGSGIAL